MRSQESFGRTQDVEKRVEHAVGQAPNELVIDLPGRQSQLLTLVAVKVGRRRLAIPHRLDGRPEHPLNLRRIRPNEDLVGQDKHVRNDDHVDSQALPERLNVIERSEVVSRTGEVNPELFLRLTDSGCEAVTIPGIVASARKRDVSRPGILAICGSLHQQDLGSFEAAKHDRHRRESGRRTTRRQLGPGGTKKALELRQIEAHAGSLSTAIKRRP